MEFEGVLYSLVPQKLHDVEDVFGFVVFHGGFPVAQGVEGYAIESGVSQFLCYPFSLFLVASSDG